MRNFCYSFFLLLLVCCFVLYKPKISSLDVTNLKELSEPRESSKGRQKSRESVVHARALVETHSKPPTLSRHALYTHELLNGLCVYVCPVDCELLRLLLFCSFYRREKHMNVYYHPPSPHIRSIHEKRH